jgi:[ribosomal protein S18]-alanine N-acetyltransferase
MAFCFRRPRSIVLEYRLYKSPDFEPLYAVEETCFKSPFRFSRGAMRQLINSAQSATWIAEEDGLLTGFAIVEWAREDGVTVAYIPTIEVLPQKRRTGAGSALLAHIEWSAREAGASVIWLHVAEQNAPAIHLYEARGYNREGREEDFYAPGLAGLVYVKSLSNPLPNPSADVPQS